MRGESIKNPTFYREQSKAPNCTTALNCHWRNHSSHWQEELNGTNPQGHSKSSLNTSWYMPLEASNRSIHRSVSDGTHLPIQQSGVERAGKEVIASLKKIGGRWKLQRILLGSSKGLRDGWKDCCCLSGLGKVVTAVNMLLKSMVFHILICTITSFTKNETCYQSLPHVSYSSRISPSFLLALTGMC